VPYFFLPNPFHEKPYKLPILTDVMAGKSEGCGGCLWYLGFLGFLGFLGLIEGPWYYLFFAFFLFFLVPGIKGKKE